VIDTRTKLLLQDMLANARIACDQILGQTLESFASNVTLLYAAIHAVEIVGEAASQVDPAVRQTLGGLPWREAILMRNKLIHGYRSLQASFVLETVRDDFPPLIAEIERILNTEAKG
jgi:uncharacterized protein with HEPN domain